MRNHLAAFVIYDKSHCFLACPVRIVFFGVIISPLGINCWGVSPRSWGYFFTIRAKQLGKDPPRSMKHFSAIGPEPPPIIKTSMFVLVLPTTPNGSATQPAIKYNKTKPVHLYRATAIKASGSTRSSQHHHHQQRHFVIITAPSAATSNSIVITSWD